INKTIIAHEHYIDLNNFNINEPLNKRKKQIGYLGRLSEEKGIMNLIRAIPAILEKDPEVSFLIVGDGPLKSDIEAFINKYNLEHKVILVGRIPHNEMAKYLNEVKLIVIPSYTEGLPNVMLEAMACGTPVLATPVGGIPDVVRDEKTGFIMETNVEECLAKHSVRAINHPCLNQIALNARDLIEKEFSFTKAVESYDHILSDLIKHNKDQ
ncbi:MAG: glycosyltransferase family 4 protein, partial [Methanobacterium sp.]|nr:glycosyltransferase family 4 protein [Methanobacterium sp.]